MFLLKVRKLGQTLLSIPIILSLIYGCTAKIDEHGNLPTQNLISDIKIGVHKKKLRSTAAWDPLYNF